MGSAASSRNEIGSYGSVDDPRDDDTNSDELRSEIEATRAGMSETVDAIQAKLSPQNVQETAEQITERAKQAALEVVDQATERVKDTVNQIKSEVKTEIHDATIGRVERMVDNFKDTTRGASTSLIETVKANPIPAALVGIGLAWLFMNKSDSGSSAARQFSSRGYNPNDYGRNYNAGYDGGYNQGYGQNVGSQSMGSQIRNQVSNAADSVQQKAGEVAENVSETASQVRERASEFVDQAQNRVGQLTDQVQNQAQHAAHYAVDRSQAMIQDNPLMTSAIALALGAAVGFLLPETQRENELMGSTRDRLVDQVSNRAQDTLGKVQDVASEALHAAGDKAKDEAQQQGLVSKPA